jgi:hypothetical protein
MGGMQPSMLESYFDKPSLEPDVLPRHTFAAAGSIEVPRRSDTFSGAISRPSLSLRSSFSKLRRKSVSHLSEPDQPNEPTRRAMTSRGRSESVETRRSPRPLRMQSSLSRLRQRVGLDRDLYTSPPASKPSTPEPEVMPEPIRKDYSPLSARKLFSRDASYSSRAPEPQRPATSAQMHRQPLFASPQPSFASPQTSTIHRRPSPTSYQSVVAPAVTTPARKPASRPKRADSGTAIAFDDIPTQERPLPFQDIMAVQSLAERMAMYKKTREYWACADHGLVEWTGRASGPRRTQVRV